MSKVWLITGSGNGLGRDIAEAALAAGDSVVAGARRTEELAPLVAQYGERVKPVRLEVRPDARKNRLKGVISRSQSCMPSLELPKGRTTRSAVAATASSLNGH